MRELFRLRKDYQTTLSILAHEFGHWNKDGKKVFFFFSGHTDALRIVKELNNSQDDYFYGRLLLEKQLQEGHLSSSDYINGKLVLAKAYTNWTQSKMPRDEQSLRSKLRAAEQQITEMQTQVDSLKGQLAQAQQSTAEKWIPIIIAFLSLLIALSTHIIAWRNDRRQAHEAELLPLKRQELEQNVAQNDQQLKESNRKIITPTPQELQLYSKVLLVDNSNLGECSKIQYRRRQ